MRGYYGIELTSSACVRFVRNDDVDGSEHEVFEAARTRGIRCAYVDLSSSQAQGDHLANRIADALRLEHAPCYLCLQMDPNPQISSLFATG
jgi:hypothetical protein